MSYIDQLFRVVYDFTSDSDVELGVREGDIVIAEAPPQESWLLVHLKNDPSKKGYVPSDFVERYQEPTSTRSPVPSSSRSSLGGGGGAVGSGGGRGSFIPERTRITTTKDPRPPLSESLEGALGNEGASGSGVTFTETYAKHEQYFKKIMKQREETFKKLEQSISSTQEEIRTCQSKNQELSQRIRELDHLVEEERRKWKDRLEEEKRLLVTEASASKRG
eukprot:TRINITY_DN82736_c0_g1_i1.p1 TRINITY_DN82736_c0_g1~~TRINITY_DN82736_c0_g1_i1.p1  ORF type:complete len:220 (-),score=63.62 TRINITY_DN82736_c0_g1_i1:409-1068(-)